MAVNADTKEQDMRYEETNLQFNNIISLSLSLKAKETISRIWRLSYFTNMAIISKRYLFKGATENGHTPFDLKMFPIF